jgi:hypothetical protein
MANKRLSIFKVLKTNWFLSANEPQSNPQRRQEPTFRAKSNPNPRLERTRWMGGYKVGYTDARLGRQDYRSLSDDSVTLFQNGQYVGFTRPPKQQQL